MFFTLKKIIGQLLMPLPLLLLIMAVALLLLWFSHWQRCAKSVLTACWLCLLLFSLQPVADRLLKPIEQQYSTYDGLQHFQYIVVLGGGYTYNPHWAPSSNLLNNNLPRVTEGIRLYLAQSGSKLVFTGAKSSTNIISSAETAARVATSLGVPQRDIIVLDTPRDTESEASAVKQLLGTQPFLLVTSANHLPRAISIFQQQGLFPVAAAANQLAINSPLSWWEKTFPSALYLSHTERAWYETMGKYFLYLTGVREGEIQQ